MLLVQDLVGTWYHKGRMSRMCGEMHPDEAGQTSITKRTSDGNVRLHIRVHKLKLHVWVHAPLGPITRALSHNTGPISKQLRFAHERRSRRRYVLTASWLGEGTNQGVRWTRSRLNNSSAATDRRRA